METIKSEFMKVSKSDLVKGSITAMITIILTALYNSLEAGQFPTDIHFWVVELKLGLGAGISYVLKNWITNSKDQFLKKETPVN